MTSSEQPPYEMMDVYILTKEDWLKLREHLTIGCTNQKVFLDTLRPHPAPQEDGCKFRVAKMEAMYDNGYADGSRKAREDFCEGLKKDLESRFIPSSNEWSKGRNSGLIECCNIIDEHRSITPQTEQEQPR